jgi:hypothetical protein
MCAVGEFLYIYMFILRELLGCREHWCHVWSDGNMKATGRVPLTVNPHRQIISGAF